jgi:N-acetyltransferase
MSMPDFQPTLTGPTVIVRPIAAADWAELLAAGSDPEIWKVHPSPDRYTEPAFRAYFDGALAFFFRRPVAAKTDRLDPLPRL